MSRAIILLFDSFGIGYAADAKPEDVGANTFAHIVQHCFEGKADKPGLRQGPLCIPNLLKLGLGAATKQSSSEPLPGCDVPETEITGAYGYAVEQSLGKDTPSGHWEIAGVPVTFEWGYFPETEPCFPKKLTDALIEQANLPGVLGNRHQSGTEIIAELGPEHIASGKPIIYTSADSVFQIAAHEQYFGLERLYEVCDVARQLVDEYQIGRVIARPFIGEPGSFTRTGNRRDLSTPPPAPTLLDHICAANQQVIAIGKIADIYAHQGISQTIKADGLDNLFDATLTAHNDAPEGSLIFTNFVNFDSHFGHRRDVPGYAHALEYMDKRLLELQQQLQPDDLVVITADHGCDPTWQGFDHTREHIPVLMFGPNIKPGSLGRRNTFADIGQTIAHHLGLSPLSHGKRCF